MRVTHSAKRWASAAAFASLVFGILPPASSQTTKKPTAKSGAANLKKIPLNGAGSFTKDVRPVITKYCVGCHGGANPAAGLALDKDTTEAAVAAHREIWDRVALNVGSGHMPPAGMPAPTKAQRTTLTQWIQASLAGDCKLADPGRVTMRRMNRLEYNNTVEDLTGLDLHLADDFPSDDVGYGFDNIGDVLSISPLLMEKYLGAAEKIAKAVVYIAPEATRYEGEKLKNVGGGDLTETGWTLFSTGSMVATHTFPHAGMYTIRIRAYGQQAGPEPTKMKVSLDQTEIAPSLEVKATEKDPGTFEFPVRVTEGKHEISASYLNDYYVAGPPAQDRNLIIDWIEVGQPSASTDGMPEPHKRVFGPGKGIADPHKAEQKIFKVFASRAYRRPATPEEVDRLTQIADLVRKDGEPFERGIQIGVQAVLSSPNFLFRVEREDGKGKLSPYELASRLSYFLWASMPDDRLLSLAASGELSKPAILTQEAKRMLNDPRASALSDGFASQWLNLRKLATIVPDPKMFPDFNDSVRDSMTKETRMFFDGVVRNDRSILDFLVGNYSYLNDKLAKVYGIPGVEGDKFRRVSLAGTPRAGVLTQGSVLTLTSNPTRTSPTKRGKWVLEELFNQPPPPPPPGVGLLNDDAHQLTGETLRKRMEQHRKDPACATCHMRMDPMGFSLENFDAIGKWRTMEGPVPVDASGELPDGTKFKGPVELRGILMKRKADFVRCLSEKMLTYAIGRGTEISDRCYVDSIAKSVEQHDYKFSALIAGVVASDPFRTRHDPAKGTK